MAANLIEFAQELKRNASIEQIIGPYVPSLKRAGKSFKGLCPFHEEKTPSFHVHPDWGRYHCFGCGAGGDVIKFIQEYEKFDFPLAVESLAKQLGVAIPEFRSQLPKEERDKRQERQRMMLAVCRLAQRFFADQLRKHPRGSIAREYLDRRGLTPDQITTHGLGYAPPEFDAFLNEARRHGYRDDLIAEAGMASRGDRGNYYDRFRDRIIFPIADMRGEVIAFGGRLMQGDGAKYLNSADTPLFHKGRLLYGLGAAREAIRTEQRVVLLEGYMDWLALHGEGIGFVVAGLGTALTHDQARLLQRMTPEVILNYDGDEAGIEAMRRAARLLLAEGVNSVRLAALPAGEDPDSYIRARGSGAVHSLLDAAPSAIDYFLERAVAAYPTTTPEGKLDAIQSLAALVHAIGDPALQDGYVHRIAGRLGLQPGMVWGSLRKNKPRLAAGSLPASGLPTGDGPGPIFNQLECALLNRLIQVMGRWTEFDTIHEDLFTDERLRPMFSIISEKEREVGEGSDPPEDWLNFCNSEPEILTMNHILFFNERHAGGAVIVKEASRTGLMAEIREIIARLRRRRNKSLRREEAGRLRQASGTTGMLGENLARIHRHSQSVLDDTDLLTGSESFDGQ